MILALEPIVNKGSGEVELDKDGYTFKTKDGKRSAHFEDTILITKNGAEILTKK
jgi:methionyl aminopeptidase